VPALWPLVMETIEEATAAGFIRAEVAEPSGPE